MKQFLTSADVVATVEVTWPATPGHSDPARLREDQAQELSTHLPSTARRAYDLGPVDRGMGQDRPGPPPQSAPLPRVGA
jgi:hypothetical protein